VFIRLFVNIFKIFNIGSCKYRVFKQKEDGSVRDWMCKLKVIANVSLLEAPCSFIKLFSVRQWRLFPGWLQILLIPNLLKNSILRTQSAKCSSSENEGVNFRYWESTPFQNFQTADSIRKMFSVGELGCQLKVGCQCYEFHNCWRFPDCGLNPKKSSPSENEAVKKRYLFLYKLFLTLTLTLKINITLDCLIIYRYVD